MLGGKTGSMNHLLPYGMPLTSQALVCQEHWILRFPTCIDGVKPIPYLIYPSTMAELALFKRLQVEPQFMVQSAPRLTTTLKAMLPSLT